MSDPSSSRTGLDVDHGGLEQQVAHGGRPHPLIEVGEHPARQAQTVRVNAARGDPDHRIAGLDAGARDHGVEIHQAHAEAHEIEAVGRRVAPHHVRQDRQLPAGDLHTGLFRARA